MIFNIKPVSAAIAVMALLGSAPAFGFEPIEFDNGATLDWKLTSTYTLGMRLEGRDPVLSGNNAADSNDGNNAFRKGSLTANRLGLLLDAHFSKGSSGFVLSGSSFYDDVYHQSNDNKYAVNHPGRVNKFTRDAKRYHGGYSRLLDAYAYTSFKVGDSRASVRLGRHVVAWGEALFFPSISLAQGPADGTKTDIAGTETKDILLPEDQISGVFQVTPRWSLMGHVQFNFQETLASAPGSFMSTADGVGPGAVCIQPWIDAMGGCTFGLRGADIKPSKTGQWGIGTRYRVTDATELGLYYLNYHDRTPVPQINPITQSYNIRYFDNVQLIGTSFSTAFGAATLAGELSYKHGAPVLVDTVATIPLPPTYNPVDLVIQNPTRADITQLNLNSMYNVGRTSLASSMLLMGEISAVKVSNIKARKAPGEELVPYPFFASDKLSFSSTGIAITGHAVLEYPGIYGGWDLAVPISYAQQLKGRTLTGGVGGQGDKRASISALFTYQENLQLGLTYNGFFGSPDVRTDSLATNRLLTDRDQLSFTMKYTF